MCPHECDAVYYVLSVITTHTTDQAHNPRLPQVATGATGSLEKDIHSLVGQWQQIRNSDWWTATSEARLIPDQDNRPGVIQQPWPLIGLCHSHEWLPTCRSGKPRTITK